MIRGDRSGRGQTSAAAVTFPAWSAACHSRVPQLTKHKDGVGLHHRQGRRQANRIRRAKVVRGGKPTRLLQQAVRQADHGAAHKHSCSTSTATP
jgi:hypothetical protein